MINYHETVMVEEAIEGLHINTGSKYIDATLGNGGHTIEILKRGGKVLGIDMDLGMIEITEERIGKTEYKKDFVAIQGNFKDIDLIAKENDWQPVSGILFDLGVTNLHLKDLERGFSFENEDALLDMRIDPIGNAIKGSDLLNLLREDQLINLFSEVLSPGASRWLAKKVVEFRKAKAISTVGDFLEICRDLKIEKTRINIATLPFLALRMAVNSELDNLKEVLLKAYSLLVSGGRLVIISFHSGEDVIVKDFYKKMEKSGAKIVTLKPVKPSSEEILTNRRARSAKIRIIEKC